MITLLIIWLILSAIGIYKFYWEEKDLDDISFLYTIPLAFTIVIVPSASIISLLYLIIKYLP
jgi:hypothetical protein